MSKSQKASAKFKRGKRHTTYANTHSNRHAHAHAHVHNHNTRPDGLEKEVENSRKAVERQLIYLSESNRPSVPTRPGRRVTAGRIGGAGGAPIGAGTGGGGNNDSATGNRRRQAKKPHQMGVSLPMREDTPSPKQKSRSRARTPYNGE